MKNKRKAINAELRKESKAFDGWMKYEVTVKEEDGSISKIPAYGKDLQDALRRVVHDEKVKTIEDKVINKIPETGWAFAWILGMVLLVVLGYEIADSFIAYWIIGTVILYSLFTLSISNWFRLRNKAK